MSWHFSRELVVEFSELNCLDGESCAQLRSTRIAERSYFDDRKKASSKRSRSGMIYEPSTVNRGVAKWMSLLEAFPASHSQLPDSNEEKQTSGICGPRQSELFKRSSLDMFCLKMCQEYRHTCPWSSETCAELAIPLKDPLNLGRSMSEHHTEGNGSGLWPTITTQEIEHPDMEISEAGRRMTLDGSDSHSMNLADKVQIGVTHYLPDGCPSYPTPIKWPTPQEDDSSNVHPSDKRSPTLVSTVDDGKGQLNPDWVCWLMGWPIGWESLKPFEWGNWPSDEWWSIDPADNESNKDWPTPSSTPRGPHTGREVTEGGQTVSDTTGTAWGMTLETAVKKYPTPRAIYGEHPGMKDPSHLTGSVQKWPSPRAGNPGSRPNMKGGKILAEEAKKTISQGTIPRVATGIPNRVDRLKALGNGQVPLCVKVAWEILIKEVI